MANDHDIDNIVYDLTQCCLKKKKKETHRIPHQIPTIKKKLCTN